MKIKELKSIFKGRFYAIKQMNSGGNATVYSVKKPDIKIPIALKVLDSSVANFKEKRDRFIIETEKVSELQYQFNTIIPIMEYGLPDELNRDLYWYTMPIAKPINEHFADIKDIPRIVKSVIDLADTLAALHECGIVHRDIKPSNVYFYNGEYCLADFGLVDYPGKDDITKSDEQIGAKATIAPEMKRDAKNADGKKADVYSLAKTLWMLLTKSDYGFEGVYNPNSPVMKLENHYKGKHLVEITKLLIDSTQDEPTLRPTMRDFALRLVDYCLIYKDFNKSNLSQWRFVQEILFKDHIPSSSYWDDLDDIVKVINLLGTMPSLNHMFIPSGGGLDFEYAETSAEEGCIELHASPGIYIIKPKRLVVENIRKDFIWSYFKLELEELQASAESIISDNTEFVTEHLPGKYISWKCGNYGYYENDDPLPEGYRLVTRVLSGSFVLFSKASIYNSINGTYDARHVRFDTSEFRKYIEQMRQDYLNMSYAEFIQRYNPNPFNSEPIFDDATIRKLVQQSNEMKELIKYFFRETDFSIYCIDNVLDVSDENALHYTISVNFNEDTFGPNIYLMNNGKFVPSTLPIYTRYARRKIIGDKYVFFSFASVESFINMLDNAIAEICRVNNLPILSPIYFFHIEIHRNRAPVHIFTKDEIKEVLIYGNDCKNNTLVIDGDGYPRLIEETVYYKLNQFPVVHETYNAFNNYVGKHTSLSHLDDEYISSLQGWLIHLQNGGSHRMDYVQSNTCEDELLDHIKQYY